MHDRVAEVLAQRATLDRGAGIGVVLSILFHGALTAAVVYTALRATPPSAATMVSIQFAPTPAAAPAAPSRTRRAEARPTPPAAIEEPKIVEPTPVVEKPPETPKKPEKNTVPLSPFGQSTKKGSEAPVPAPAPPPTANRQPPTGSGPEIAVGGSGVTGLEGGDFPHALYLERMHKLIGDKWYRPAAVTPGTTVVVFFRILRDGTVAEARVATPSGNTTFDRAALSAVRSASPLNPLPFAYSGKELGIELTFR
jgi:TonB family protein